MPYEDNIESPEIGAQQFGFYGPYPYGGYPYGPYPYRPYPYQPFGYGIGGFLFPFLLGALLF